MFAKDKEIGHSQRQRSHGFWNGMLRRSDRLAPRVGTQSRFWEWAGRSDTKM